MSGKKKDRGVIAEVLNVNPTTNKIIVK